jgi:hypothetical protein
VTLNGTSSTDPDGDLLSYTWTGPFEGGTDSGPTPTVQFSGFGQYSTNLNITDGFGGTATCSADVLVVDTTPPTINCNAPSTIVPPDAPISFNATATDICVGAIDAEIIAFDCFTFAKKGKRIDKTQSCEVAIAEGTITILDSGGVDNRIIWEVGAIDDSGNTNKITCEVLVINPALKNK